MQGPYADHLLDAADVCSNCLRKTRVERVDPVRSTTDFRHELDAHLSRHKRRTEIGYGPSEAPAHSKGVFCSCGVEGTHDRLWDPEAVGEDKFKALLTAAIETLREKRVTLKERETIRYAVSHWREHDDVDKALATALEAGIVAAVAGGSEDRQRA